MTTVPSSSQLDTQDIQGNILAPFRCDRQAFIFLGFRHQRDCARKWLKAAVERITFTDQVPGKGDLRDGAPSTPLMNVGFTATGLVALCPEVAADLAQFDAFWNGPLGLRLDDTGHLTTTAALLGDVDRSDPRRWLIGGPGRPPVDALLTIAGDDEQTLQDWVTDELVRAKKAGLEVLPLEPPLDADSWVLWSEAQWAKVIRDEKGHRIEHFGFADGISQPRIRGFSDVDASVSRTGNTDGSPIIAAGEFILGWPGERRPPARTQRPTAPRWMHNGSFQVVRRLRQNVAGWNKKAVKDAERAIGRQKNGTPLAPDGSLSQPNSFDYRNDENGQHTPLFAHIRKMNPRDDAMFRDRSHKLLRRGITFGPCYASDVAETAERGLLFNAYMASIEDQFEFLQRRWANDPDFPSAMLATVHPETGKVPKIAGLDPVIGNDKDVARRRLGTAADAIPREALGGLVTTTGAVYAFAPSRKALNMLANNEPVDA